MKKNLSTYVINAQFFPALVKDGVKYKSPEDRLYHQSLEMLVFLRKLLTDYGYQDHNKYGNIA